MKGFRDLDPGEAEKVVTTRRRKIEYLEEELYAPLMDGYDAAPSEDAPKNVRTKKTVRPNEEDRDSRRTNNTPNRPREQYYEEPEAPATAYNNTPKRPWNQYYEEPETPAAAYNNTPKQPRKQYREEPEALAATYNNTPKQPRKQSYRQPAADEQYYREPEDRSFEEQDDRYYGDQDERSFENRPEPRSRKPVDRNINDDYRTDDRPRRPLRSSDDRYNNDSYGPDDRPKKSRRNKAERYREDAQEDPYYIYDEDPSGDDFFYEDLTVNNRKGRRRDVVPMRRNTALIIRNAVLITALFAAVFACIIMVTGQIKKRNATPEPEPEKQEVSLPPLDELPGAQEWTGENGGGASDLEPAEVPDEPETLAAPSEEAGIFFEGYEVHETAGTVELTDDDVRSEFAVIIDMQSGEVIAGKKSDEVIAPASMTKILTLLVGVRIPARQPPPKDAFKPVKSSPNATRAPKGAFLVFSCNLLKNACGNPPLATNLAINIFDLARAR